MALAVSTPGSEFYGNDSLKRDVIDGMDWMEANRYNPSIPLYDNWWMFVIGTPLNITRVMTLLYDDLTPEQRARYEAAMNHYAPDVTYEGRGHRGQQSMAVRRNGRPRIPHAGPGETGYGRQRAGNRIQNSHYERWLFTKTVRSYSTSGIPYTGGYGRSLLENLVNR